MNNIIINVQEDGMLGFQHMSSIRCASCIDAWICLSKCNVLALCHIIWLLSKLFTTFIKVGEEIEGLL